MMCTSLPAPPGRGPSTTWSKIDCTRWQGYSCIRAKPESGTERARVLQNLRTLARRSGVPEVRRSWAHQSAHKISSDLWEWRGCKRSSDCGKPSVGCQICNVHGRSSCSVQGPAATTLWAPSHPASPSSTRKATIDV